MPTGLSLCSGNAYGSVGSANCTACPSGSFCAAGTRVDRCDAPNASSSAAAFIALRCVVGILCFVMRSFACRTTHDCLLLCICGGDRMIEFGGMCVVDGGLSLLQARSSPRCVRCDSTVRPSTARWMRCRACVRSGRFAASLVSLSPYPVWRGAYLFSSCVCFLAVANHRAFRVVSISLSLINHCEHASQA